MKLNFAGLAAVLLMASLLVGTLATSALAATTIPAVWTAGGLSAGLNSAGQAARMTADASGNVAVVSGPSNGRDLAVTSYTATGSFRWRGAVSPSSGTFAGDWVTAAPNGDFVAVGHNRTSRGQAIGITMVRYASNGTLQWRVDLARTIPSVARLIVDSGGNAYLAFNSVGDGQDIQLHKYNPSGVLLWSQLISTGSFANDIATSLALSPDQADVVLSGDIAGGATWITAAYNATTGARRWLVAAAEGTAARDVVVDASRVYVTGQGSVGINGFLTVVAYDRATGSRLWRTDANPPTCCAYGTRSALAPDGSIVVAGQTSSGGYFDWWIVSFSATGTVRWQTRRDAALAGDEIPAAVLVLADGTAVVSGTGGPVTRDILGNSYMQGVTAGYSSNGTLLWEAFATLPTVWATALPNGDVCATGGYDALITCWRVSGQLRAVMSATPSTGTAPLSVNFDGSGSTTPSGTVTSWAWSFGDGASGAGIQTTHVYTNPGTYTASLTVTNSSGASSTATGSIVVNPSPPAAPSGLTASPSGNLVLLAWQDNSSNETAFSVERCAGSGCTNFAPFATQSANAPSYTDYSATAGQSYGYRVRASNTGGNSQYSNIARVVAGASNQPPAAIISATPSTGTAPLTVAFGGSGSSDPDGTISTWSWSFGDGTTSAAINPSHTYTGAGTYIATLTVTDNNGASASSSATIVVNGGTATVPGAPTLTAAPLGFFQHGIRLTWSGAAAHGSPITGYRIYRGTSSGGEVFLTAVGNVGTFTDASTSGRTTYYYTVSAVNGIGEGPRSVERSARSYR